MKRDNYLQKFWSKSTSCCFEVEDEKNCHYCLFLLSKKSNQVGKHTLKTVQVGLYTKKNQKCLLDLISLIYMLSKDIGYFRTTIYRH